VRRWRGVEGKLTNGGCHGDCELRTR
jgi:hypothetical protein